MCNNLFYCVYFALCLSVFLRLSAQNEAIFCLFYHSLRHLSLFHSVCTLAYSLQSRLMHVMATTSQIALGKRKCSLNSRKEKGWTMKCKWISRSQWNESWLFVCIYDGEKHQIFKIQYPIHVKYFNYVCTFFASFQFYRFEHIRNLTSSTTKWVNFHLKHFFKKKKSDNYDGKMLSNSSVGVKWIHSSRCL